MAGVVKARAVRLFLGSAVCAVALAGTSAAAMAGSIAGSVTADAGGAPIEGVEVCATPQPYTFEVPCVETSSSGAYSVPDLPGGAYYLRFYGDRYNLDYIDESYDDEIFFPGDLVTIGSTEAKTGVNAGLQVGGRIAGAVTEAEGGDPVAGLQVCAFGNTLEGGAGRCTRTDSSGEYIIRGLPDLSYQVEFIGDEGFNYLTQYWQASETPGDWDPVEVTLGDTTTGIDAELNPGAEISGRLTEAGTGNPVADVAVSLLDPVSEEVVKWVNTDSAGNYAFGGRPAGTYIVAFSRPRVPFDGDGFTTQYYKGATSFAAATPLTVAPPEVLTGIDGEVASLFPSFQPDPESVKVTILPVEPQGRPPLRCRKGFRKKTVKGKARCVKVHKRKQRRNKARR